MRLVLTCAAAWCLAVTAAPAGEEPAAAGAWARVAEAAPGQRSGAPLLWAADLRKFLLVGDGVSAFDPAAGRWEQLSPAKAEKGGIDPYYQAAYDPGTRTIYCLSGGSVLYTFSCAELAWKKHPPAPELEGMSWLTMAFDPAGKRLVAVGADKKLDNLGWSRTVLYSIAEGRWSPLPAPADDVVRRHRALVEAVEAAIDLGGRIRLAWYRDPAGTGTDAEREDLGRRCKALAGMPGLDAFKAEVESAGALLNAKKTLEALRAVRALQRRVEEAAFAQWPAPPSRRNSPLVCDAKNNACVLFGGDHEDYLMNDTWVLDLGKLAWRRARPDRAPAPRAGHALVPLPASGRVAMYEGYVQTSNAGYGSAPWWPADPVELWTYDLKADRWECLAVRPLPGKDQHSVPAPNGHFYGYASERFSPPALAADPEDRLFLASAPPTAWFLPWKGHPKATWALRPDPAGADAAEREKRGAEPNSRRYRTGSFLAAFCEEDVPAQVTDYAALPANRWTRLPDPPRNPCRGCRQRDWGTYVWDSDRDQILVWGGGHCVRSGSVVAHWSPASGRMAEGYDVDEPYGANGGGGYDSSVLNRPWVSVHNYNHYAYDPKCRMLVSARGYLYDPDRMDWVRMEPMNRPFVFKWGSTLVETTPHGAVAWAQRAGGGEAFGLWLFDRGKGWTDLEPKGRLGGLYCDSEGAVYDSKRDRLLMGGGGGYNRRGDGTMTVFDFATKTVDKLTPENIELGKTRNAREMVYVPEADIVIFGSEPYTVGGEKGRRLTRVLDCEKNKYFLLDAGEVAYGHSSGWMYDAKRRCVLVITCRGELWAMRVDPRELKLLDTPPEK